MRPIIPQKKRFVSSKWEGCVALHGEEDKGWKWGAHKSWQKQREFFAKILPISSLRMLPRSLVYSRTERNYGRNCNVNGIAGKGIIEVVCASICMLIIMLTTYIILNACHSNW